MEKIFPKSLANSANPTIVAMINTFLAVVVPQLADIAIVVSCIFPALMATLGCRLGISTEHAEHVLRISANQRMLLDFVVAEPARVPFLASEALKLDVSFIMLTA
jgi:hypothetical protein